MTDLSLARPAVSIVIPTYKGGSNLIATVQSCLENQDVELEVIVVDDASPDDTLECLSRRFSPATYPQLKILRSSTNSGSGAAGRNRGLAAAQGTYIKFLDHDDQLEPGTLAHELQAAELHQADLVLSWWGDIQMDADGKPVQETKREFIPPQPEQLINAILEGQKVPYTAAVLYRKSHICSQHWDPRLTIIDDFDYLCRAALRTDNIITIDTVSYYWRRYPHSLQGRQANNPKSLLEAVYIHSHIYSQIGELLKERRLLTPARETLLARQLYRDLRVLARFDRSRCQAQVDRIYSIRPGYCPDAFAEPSSRIRSAIRVIGLRAFLLAYAMLRWLPDRLKPLQGDVEFFLAEAQSS